MAQKPRKITDPIEAREIYDRARQVVVSRVVDPEARKRALAKFDTDPRTLAIRKVAGLVPEEQRKRDIQETARQNVAARSGEQREGGILPEAVSDFSRSVFSGTGQAMFGIPEIVDAGVRYAVPAIFGTDTKQTTRGRTYGETLDLVRAEREAEKQLNTAGATVGQVGGSVIGGSGASNLALAGSAKLAASATPAVARTGNALRGVLTLQRGQNFRNAARLATEGAAFGTLQAAGEGSDLIEGALYGAGGALTLGGAAKAGQIARNQVRQFSRMGSSSVPKALREVIKEAPDAIASRQQQLSQATGEPVPVVAALNDADFKRASEAIVNRSEGSTEIAKDETGKYLRNFMDRMLGHVNQAGKTADAPITTIGDLAQLRKDTADEIMRPIEKQEIDLTTIPFDKLERQVAREIGLRIRDLAPRIRQALRDVDPNDPDMLGIDGQDMMTLDRLISAWGLSGGKESVPVLASFRELDNLRRTLNAAAKSAETGNPGNSMAYKGAADTLGEFLASSNPAYRKMLDTYAGHSRMLEGFKTAREGKRITDLTNTQMMANLRTTEGRLGMRAGELFRQREAVTARPTSAIRAARDYAAQGNLTRPAGMAPDAAQPGTITENLGDRAAANLARASQAESQVLGRVLDTQKLDAMGNVEDATGAVDPYDLGRSLAIAGAMPGTKIRIAIGIVQGLVGRLPTPVARQTAERATQMLFSNDPAAIRSALASLRTLGLSERMIAGYVQNALPANAIAAIGASGGGDISALQSEETPLPEAKTEVMGEIDPSQMSDEELLQFLAENEGETVDPSQMSVEELLQFLSENEGGGDYSQDLEALYQNENPELIDLIERVSRQESRGSQFDEAGNPLQSSAGAIGVMQVMPATAPEAAQLAGLPWDEAAYYGDPAYNKLIGTAYLSEMLRRYDGDVRLALVAYNAGPKRADALASGKIEVSQLPAETQDYIAKIM